MQLIKNQKIAHDDWTFIADDAELKNDYNIVSVKRWENESATLKQQSAHLGLRLEPDAHVEDMVEALANFQLIELYMPVYTDGRAFTHAQLLRHRYHYTGDIRVSGDLMRDQVFYMNRVGASSFVFDDHENAQQIIDAMHHFSVTYQEAIA